MNIKSNTILKYWNKSLEIINKFDLQLNSEIVSKKVFKFDFKKFKFTRNQKSFVFLKGIEKINIKNRNKIKEINEEMSNLNIGTEENTIIFKKFKRKYIRNDKIFEIIDLINLKTNEKENLSFNLYHKPTILTFSSHRNSNSDFIFISKQINVQEHYNLYYIFAGTQKSIEIYKKFLLENNLLNQKEITYLFLENYENELELFDLTEIFSWTNLVSYIFDSEGLFIRKIEENENLNEALDSISKKIVELNEIEEKSVIIDKYCQDDISKLNKLLMIYCKDTDIKLRDSNCKLEFIIDKKYSCDIKGNVKVHYNTVHLLCIIPKKYIFIYEEIEDLLIKNNLKNKIKIEISIFSYKSDLDEYVKKIINFSDQNGGSITLDDLQFEELIYVRNGVNKKLYDIRNLGKIDFCIPNIEGFCRIMEYIELTKKNLKKNSIFRDIQFTPKLSLGDYFVPINKLKKINNLLDSSVLLHNQGEILLVYFWTLENKISQGSILAINQILSKNTSWIQKIRISCISIDEYCAVSNFLIKENLSSSIENYIQDIKNEKEGIFYNSIYGIYGYPTLILINKNGTINYIGSPFSLDLESEVNTLLNEEENKLSASNTMLKNIQYFDPLIIKNIKNIMTELTNELNQKINYNYKFNFSCSNNFKLNKNFKKEEISLNFLKLDISLRKSDYDDAFDFLNNEIFSKIPKEKFDITSESLDVINIIPGSLCEKCKRNISSDEGEYFCYFCNIYFCVNCSETLDNNKKGIRKLNHDHNLIFLVSKINKNSVIDLYKLGKKISLDENYSEIESQNHQAACNCCEKTISNTCRYICLTCNPGCIVAGGFNDYCMNCFKILTDKSHKDNIILRDKALKNDNHDSDTHIYLRLYYSYGDYFNY